MEGQALAASIQKAGREADAPKMYVTRTKKDKEREQALLREKQKKEAAERRAEEQQKEVLGTELLRAAATGAILEVQRLLNDGAEANFVDESEISPLIKATMYDNAQVARILVSEWGARIDHQEERGRTACMFAAANSCVDTLLTLLELGADCTSLQANNGFTPAMFAAVNGHDRIISELLKHAGGATLLRKRDGQGQTALDLATMAMRGEDSTPGHGAVVALLEAAAQELEQDNGRRSMRRSLTRGTSMGDVLREGRKSMAGLGGRLSRMTFGWLAASRASAAGRRESVPGRQVV